MRLHDQNIGFILVKKVAFKVTRSQQSRRCSLAKVKTIYNIRLPNARPNFS